MTEEEILVVENEATETINAVEEALDSTVEENIVAVEVADIRTIEVGVDSAFPALGNSNDMSVHNNLSGLDAPNAHPISAIKNLREELNKLDTTKTPRTLYSDKLNVANYYEWQDNAYDETGYFVSVASGTSQIKICDGTSDIFGVSVDSAGFIGNQSADIPRGNEYGLIVTTGIVDVRCESDVEIGDRVVSNSRGYARKSNSDYGYKVLAIENKTDGVYAVISLGVQADIINSLGVYLDNVKKQVDVNYNNIVSAINLANQAYQKSLDAEQSSSVSEEAIKEALDAVLGMEDVIKNVEQTLESTNSVATQAKAIADSAVTSATTLTNEATARANEAWAKADYVETEARSLCAKIDQHSVGEYSQAYGLTWEQAQSILTPGMIYVPTTKHTEEYISTDDGGNPPYSREFTVCYLYQWGYLPLYQKYGWVTVDKYYHELTDINPSAPSVYFSITEPIIVEGDSHGYWYTDGEEITDKNGQTGTYEPYTLYKWETDHWVAVATLKGNVSNRMVSEVYQTTNEIMLDIINPRGGIVGFNAQLTDTEAQIQSLSSWKNGGETSSAIIKQHAENGKSSIVISTIQEENGEISEAASLVLTVSKDDNSRLLISADNIEFEGNTTFVTPEDLGENGTTTISGSRITTGTITSNNYEETTNEDGATAPVAGMKLSLNDGTWSSPNFNIDAEGNVTIEGEINATSGSIGDLKITGQLYFGDSTSYFINANYNDESYYIKLPGFKVDLKDGAVFSGKLSAASGSFTSIHNVSVEGGNVLTIDDTISLKSTSSSVYISPGLINTPEIHIKAGGIIYCSNGDLSGTWTLNSATILTSDKNLKNSIETLSDNYDMFFDKIQPVRYKYNDGTSNRYHTGFIAQDVESAILDAGLSTNEAALFVRSDTWKNKETGEIETRCGLRYSEFVSLNTWQIQKLKARIKEIEDKVAALSN